ncbi:glycosyltransferase family 4 protein [Nakamurella leprariae]|uniref:Glycosyltransferase family 4 protein n=1 Tax=Nakamurella leprariae TaxID=2803911 RepID=A0A938YDJ8_9ACTN|nr:glycosyltransferase family 4 protein [Nakamurella leprariae]MBM9467869.1 glycosyltransferase family 4 protein [Nakamurella leprariae]
MRYVVNAVTMAPIGGVEMSTTQVNRRLAERGHEVHALYRDPGVLLPEWQSFARSVVRVPSFDWHRDRAARELWQLRPAVQAARAARPDVIYLNRVEQIGWGLAAAGASRASLVVHLRNQPSFPGMKVVSRMTARFIAVSECMRRIWIDSGVEPDKITTVHNGILAEDYPVGGLAERAAARAELGLPRDAFIPLYLGRVAPEKGVPTLLQAWRRLGWSTDDARLLLVGTESSGPEYEHLLEVRRDEPAGLHWLPKRRDVITALHAADVVVLPALWEEPFGRVVIEAMATGRPIVASRVGGIPEIMTGEAAQWLVEPGDADAIAAQLAALRDWRRDDPGLADRCVQHVRREFSLDRTADGVESVLQDVVHSRRRAGRAGGRQLAGATAK